jgi:hypothetical protein
MAAGGPPARSRRNNDQQIPAFPIASACQKAGLLVVNEENNPTGTPQKHSATTTKKDRPRFSAKPICFLQFHEDLEIIC